MSELNVIRAVSLNNRLSLTAGVTGSTKLCSCILSSALTVFSERCRFASDRCARADARRRRAPRRPAFLIVCISLACITARAYLRAARCTDRSTFTVTHRIAVHTCRLKREAAKLIPCVCALATVHRPNFGGCLCPRPSERTVLSTKQQQAAETAAAMTATRRAHLTARLLIYSHHSNISITCRSNDVPTALAHPSAHQHAVHGRAPLVARGLVRARPRASRQLGLARRGGARPASIAHWPRARDTHHIAFPAQRGARVGVRRARSIAHAYRRESQGRRRTTVPHDA